MKPGWYYKKIRGLATSKTYHFLVDGKSRCGIFKVREEDKEKMVKVEKEDAWSRQICGNCDRLLTRDIEMAKRMKELGN